MLGAELGGDDREDGRLLVTDVFGEQRVQVSEPGGEFGGRAGHGAGEGTGGVAQQWPQHRVLDVVVMVDAVAEQQQVFGEGCGPSGWAGGALGRDVGGEAGEAGVVGERGAMGQAHTQQVHRCRVGPARGPDSLAGDKEPQEHSEIGCATAACPEVWRVCSLIATLMAVLE
nr:hypothetical protein [Nocardia pseudovaccinii]